jgi:hypothetical protein
MLTVRGPRFANGLPIEPVLYGRKAPTAKAPRAGDAGVAEQSTRQYDVLSAGLDRARDIVDRRCLVVVDLWCSPG